jgi:hypothetical protein
MTKEDLFRKNHLLGVEFDRYLLEHPETLDQIPDGAEIYFLPEEDPDLLQENLGIAEAPMKEKRINKNNQILPQGETVFIAVLLNRNEKESGFSLSSLRNRAKRARENN